MQSNESRPKVIPFEKKGNPIIEKFKEFWSVPLEQMIQATLKNPDSYRLIYRLQNLSKDDKKILRSWVQKLEAKAAQDEEKISKVEWFFLGLCYEFNTTDNSRLTHSYSQQFKCYLKSSELGYAEGAHRLALLLENAVDAEKNYHSPEMANTIRSQAEYDTDKTLSENAALYDNRAKTLGYVNNLITVELRAMNGSITAFTKLATHYEKSNNVEQYWYMVRSIAEIDHRELSETILFCRRAGYFICSMSADENKVLNYHLAFLTTLPYPLKQMQEEFTRQTFPRQIKWLRDFFAKNALEDFETYNRLTDPDPWENVKAIFPDPEKATLFFQHKQEWLAEKIKKILAFNQNLSLDIAIHIVAETGVHPSYLANIEKFFEEKSESTLRDSETLKDREICKNVLYVTADYLNKLKQDIEQHLAETYFAKDMQQAAAFRKDQLSKIIFSGNAENKHDPMEEAIKRDGKLITLYSDLKILAEAYGLVSVGSKSNSPAKFLKRFTEILDGLKSKTGEKPENTFFKQANRFNKEDFIAEVNSIFHKEEKEVEVEKFHKLNK